MLAVRLLCHSVILFGGDRFGSLVDPYGHRWSLAQQVRIVTPEEVKKAALEIDDMCGPGE